MLFLIEVKNNHPQVNKTYSYIVISENLTEALREFQYSDGGDIEQQEITVYKSYPLADNVYNSSPVNGKQVAHFTGTIDAYLSKTKK